MRIDELKTPVFRAFFDAMQFSLSEVFGESKMIGKAKKIIFSGFDRRREEFLIINDVRYNIISKSTRPYFYIRKIRNEDIMSFAKAFLKYMSEGLFNELVMHVSFERSRLYFDIIPEEESDLYILGNPNILQTSVREKDKIKMLLNFSLFRGDRLAENYYFLENRNFQSWRDLAVYTDLAKLANVFDFGIFVEGITTNVL